MIILNFGAGGRGWRLKAVGGGGFVAAVREMGGFIAMVSSPLSTSLFSISNRSGDLWICGGVWNGFEWWRW